MLTLPAWLSLAMVLATAPTGPLASFPADVDGDGSTDLVEVYAAGRAEGSMRFLRVRTAAGGEWSSHPYGSWAASAGDLDGDGRAEIVLGVWSSTRRHDEPEPHRSVWVLRWTGQRLDEVWRGSALARPLRDAAVMPGAAGRRAWLLALEQRAAGCQATAYRWTGFGFRGVASRPLPCEDTRLQRSRGRTEIVVRGRTRRPMLRGRILDWEPHP